MLKIKKGRRFKNRARQQVLYLCRSRRQRGVTPSPALLRLNDVVHVQRHPVEGESSQDAFGPKSALSARSVNHLHSRVRGDAESGNPFVMCYISHHLVILVSHFGRNAGPRAFFPNSLSVPYRRLTTTLV